MSSAEPAPAPIAGRGILQRLDLIYFALAGFDLLTIGIALFLGHLTVTAFEEGVRTSATWSQRQADIIHLSRLAQIADAPGNDIFYSRDTRLERARFTPALAEFNADRARISGELAGATLSARDGEIERRLAAIQSTMDQMAAETETIFHEFERGREVRASRAMAVMDRTFAILINRLDEALAIVEAGRADHLETQLARARSLRSLELFIGLAMLVIVGLVAFYGAYMGRTLRNNETQRQAMLSDLARAHERLQHYANDVSHELRGPISKMRLEAEVLLQQERTPEQYRAGTESILFEAQRLSTIVESLLFLARAENAAMSLNLGPVDADRELALIADFYAAAAEKAGVALAVRRGKASVWADRALFQRALSNLVGNALEHAAGAKKITLAAKAEGERSVVEVTDDGAGIAEAALPLVFDRFQRGDANGSGLGLGLAIAKGIMELHGGSIELTSKSGQGVVAKLFFPARNAK
jgi:two-component system, OmpR family, heavy metal sensor histidine kinase CusS